MSARIAVTAVVNAHDEGLLAVPSLRSVSRNKRFALARGFDVEIIVVLDRPDSLTKEVLYGWDEPGRRVVEVDYGDPGLSRNRGIAEAKGDYVVFLDADDLWGEAWLGLALEAAARDRRNIIWHPEINIYFGFTNHIYRHIDMECQEYDQLSLVAQNYWTSLCMVERGFALALPNPKSDLASGIGFEDWGWYRETIAAGAIHKVVKGTGHVIRTKATSQLSMTRAANCIPAPTLLFRNELEKKARGHASLYDSYSGPT